MTVLKALAILEAATLECKKRDIDAPEVHEALAFLEPHIQPEWLIRRFRHELEAQPDNAVDREAQQQVLRATFPGIRESVRDLLGKQMDALAREFAATHDMKVKEEIERMAKEYDKLKEPWRFA
jgi:hypothetical protein